MRRLLALASLALATPALAQDGGGTAPLPTDELSAEARAAIHAELEAARVALGLPAPADAAKTRAGGTFRWPLALAPGLDDAGLATISAHVDHDRTAGTTQDFFCGTRTYDQHQGTDFATWPFPVLRMDLGEALVVAAAPGTVLRKYDGNDDRNCAVVDGAQWNAVYVYHDDGSVAWYGHLKKGSLTAKPEGARVEAGEVLGVVGSSGRSTGPHLHLEVYLAGALIDPYAGACNRLNTTSWWAEQQAYTTPQLLAVRTGTAAPVLGTCPAPEQPNEARTFQRGAPLVLSAYFRDAAAGDAVQWSVTGPDGLPAAVRHWDGSVLSSWTDVLPSGGRASYRYYTRSVLPDAAFGTWRVEAVYKDQRLSRTFTVVNPVALDDAAAPLERRVGRVYPNPVGEAAALDVQAAPGERVSVAAFDVLGRRVATLHDGPVPASGPLALDTRGLAQGVYALRVATATGAVTRPLVKR